jgi:hypothetical protein
MSTNLTTKESVAKVRIALKAAFPAVKFSVTNNGGTTFTSARVSWTDGPTMQEVDEVVRKFETTKLDPYTDYREAVPGTIGSLDAVQTCRTFSDEVTNRVNAKMVEATGASSLDDLMTNFQTFETNAIYEAFRVGPIGGSVPYLDNHYEALRWVLNKDAHPVAK